MLRVERINGITVLRILGDVDIASAPQLDSALRLLRDESVVIVDLEICPYFDSSGFSLLYRAIREHHLILCMPEDCNIRRLFTIVDGGKIFPIYTTETEALNAALTIVRTQQERVATDSVT